MPAYVVSNIVAGLNQQEKAVCGSRVLTVAVAYKPNVDDMRESPAAEILNIGGEVE